MALDIPSISGTDIDFSREWVTGRDELIMAALDRILTSETFDNGAFGVSLLDELGNLGDSRYAELLALQCSSAIKNDERMLDVEVTKAEQVRDGSTLRVTLAFAVTTQTVEEFSLAVLIENGDVRLLEV